MARQNEHSLESISNANSFPKCSQNKYCGKLLIYMQILLPISWIIISMLMIALRKCNILDLIFQQCYIAFFMILRCLLRINNSRLQAMNQIKSHSAQNVTPVSSKLSQIYSNPF